MGSRDKLKKRFLSQPTDFTFEELESLLCGLGYTKYNKGKTSGSRIIYKDGQGHPIMLHRPHPGNIIKRYAMRQILEELRENGQI